MENQVPEELVKEGFDKLLKVVQDTAKAYCFLQYALSHRKMIFHGFLQSSRLPLMKTALVLVR